MYPNELMLFIVSNIRSLMGDCKNITDIDTIKGIITNISTMFTGKESRELKSNITVSNLMNSKLRSKGNVFVIGNGSINSIIEADGKIEIFGKLKSGEIASDKIVELNECGSQFGTKVIVSVPENGSIIANKVHPDAVFKIGRLVHRFTNLTKNVEAKIVDGKLKL